MTTKPQFLRTLSERYQPTTQVPPTPRSADSSQIETLRTERSQLALLRALQNQHARQLAHDMRRHNRKMRRELILVTLVATIAIAGVVVTLFNSP